MNLREAEDAGAYVIYQTGSNRSMVRNYAIIGFKN
jgi:hypothetical protein